MTITPVILSGGSGTRLWPLSWGNHPKQFLPLVSDKTMIQETLLRLNGLNISAPIVSCNAHNLSAMQSRTPSLYLGGLTVSGNIWDLIISFSIFVNSKSFDASFKAFPGCVKP